MTFDGEYFQQIFDVIVGTSIAPINPRKNSHDKTGKLTKTKNAKHIHVKE